MNFVSSYTNANKIHPSVRQFQAINGEGIKMKKEKKRKGNLSSVHSTSNALKALRYGSHSFTSKLHHACLLFVSFHQLALPLTEAAYIR